MISLLRILTFIQVGKVRVIGRENLNAVDGAVIVCPNHPHYIDGAIFPILMEKESRYMADEDVLRFGFGLGALTLVPVGAFPARDEGPDSNLRTFAAGAKFLASGFSLLIFPEGHTNFNLKMQPVKRGAVQIAKLASTTLGKPVYIIPAFIRYGRYFPMWIQRIKPPLQYLIVLLAFFYFRRGATVVIGKPISSTEFPSSDNEACNFLGDRIVALDPGDEAQGVEAGMYEILPLIKL
jgi:1-acyl-sn-glycerol-3-phosphate acyltransferase